MGRTCWSTDGQPGWVGGSEGEEGAGVLYEKAHRHFFLSSDPTRPRELPLSERRPRKSASVQM